MMKINPRKTKIVVFQKRGRKNDDFRFLVDNQIIDVLHEYTYLGTRMSSSGNVSVLCEHLKEKAFHALLSVRRHTNLSKLKAALVRKVFDTMISPILTYNSEIWGVKGMCIPNQILRPWTAHKSTRHTSNFANVTYR